MIILGFISFRVNAILIRYMFIWYSFRSDLLGDTHVDTIVAMSNLAELYILQGQDVAAAELQKTILELMQAKDEDVVESAADNTSKAGKHLG